jgi:tetraacyldisaccharide 4'-kinase
LIHDAGYRVAIISRGYRSTAEKAGAVIEPHRSLTLCPRRFGDEPVLMARLLAPRPIPILVGGDRVASGRRALARFQPDVILLDDGFQHRRLARDLDIVLLDGAKPFGNGYLLPRGPLREPISALARAHILILTRCPPHMVDDTRSGPERRWTPELADKPLFASRHQVVGREYVAVGSSSGPRSGPLDLTDLKGLPVLAFAGIARNEIFRQTLVELGAEIRAWMGFRDHHYYRAADLAHLTRVGQRAGAVALVTTDKDRVRIPDGWIRQLPLMVVGVRIAFPDEDAEAFERLVFACLDLVDRREVRP